jgi:hypothetical protein
VLWHVETAGWSLVGFEHIDGRHADFTPTPPRGAAWIDPALWVIWLIAAGEHDPARAESWAARVSAWHTAPNTGLTVFADANARLWREIAGDNPDEWTTRMVSAAARWAAYRDRR